MNQATMFRLLVAASIAVALLGSAVDYFAPGLLPAVLDDAYGAYAAAEEPTMAYALALGGFSLVLLVGGIAGAIGLVLFKRWGRQLSLWLSVLAMPIYPLTGPVIGSGWATMLTEASMMLWGAALAMAYFSDVRVKFERQSD